jgi:hypothetical protein
LLGVAIAAVISTIVGWLFWEPTPPRPLIDYIFMARILRVQVGIEHAPRRYSALDSEQNRVLLRFGSF